jgi:hypothetical protein
MATSDRSPAKRRYGQLRRWGLPAETPSSPTGTRCGCCNSSLYGIVGHIRGGSGDRSPRHFGRTTTAPTQKTLGTHPAGCAPKGLTAFWRRCPKRLLDGMVPLGTSNRESGPDGSTLPCDLGQICLIDVERERVTLRQVVGRDVDVHQEMAELI